MPGFRMAAVFFCSMILSCTQAPTETIRIGINAWPGYEFLYLAEQKGFYRQVGLDVEIVQLGSLSDTQRAYLGGRIDGFASTMIEAVQASVIGGRPLQVVLIPDYSNGGDVIIGRKGLGSVQALAGKKVGVEITSLGIYLIERALSKYGLDLEDLELLNIEQPSGEEAILSGSIDAMVTYPPYSLSLLSHDETELLFSTAEIPFEIIDTLSLSTDVLQQEPKLVEKLLAAWQLSLDFTRDYPEEAYGIMAQREGIGVEELMAVFQDIVVLNSAEQSQLFQYPDNLQANARHVCETLVHVKSLETDCTKLPEVIYQGYVLSE